MLWAFTFAARNPRAMRPGGASTVPARHFRAPDARRRTRQRLPLTPRRGLRHAADCAVDRPPMTLSDGCWWGIVWSGTRDDSRLDRGEPLRQRPRMHPDRATVLVGISVDDL